jgi:nucleoside-diphosphate-sugar epimerase
MKVLVTGASGRFAQYMVAALRADCELTLFARRQPPEDRADLPWIQGDLNAYEDCVKAVQGIDVIQHLGAVPWPSDDPRSRERVQAMGRELPPFDATMKTNIIGTYYLMRAAAEAGVKIVVMTGSNCAFGHCGRVPGHEFPFQYLPLDEAHISDIESSYSYTKLVGEELLAWFTRAYGIRTYVTRPAGICPPERLENMARNAQPATDWSGGFWGYVASQDLAEMQRLLMEKAEALPAHAVLAANALDTNALEPSIELVAKFRPHLLPLAEGKMSGHDAFFSMAKARQLLGWAPKHSWRDYLG